MNENLCSAWLNPFMTELVDCDLTSLWKNDCFSGFQIFPLSPLKVCRAGSESPCIIIDLQREESFEISEENKGKIMSLHRLEYDYPCWDI